MSGAQLVIAAAIAMVALGVAAILQRRRPVDPPTAPIHDAPTQFDRRDFAAPANGWLVIHFSSRTCLGCAALAAELAALKGPDVSFVAVDDQDQRELHQRYRITGVPTVVVVDEDGVTRAAWLGAPPPGAVAATLSP